MTSKIPVTISIILSLIILAPLVYIYLTAGITAAIIERTLGLPGLGTTLVTTFFPYLIASFFLVAFSTVYVWLINRSDIPGKRALFILPFMGLSIPAVVRAIGWVFLFSPRIGIINLAFDDLFRVKWPLFNIFSNYGLTLASISGGFTFSYILMTAAVRGMDPALEDNARVCGSSLFTTFRTVTLPQLLPAMTSVYVFTFVLSAGVFDYPYIFGSVGTSGIRTLATVIDGRVTDLIPPDYAGAATLSLYYVLILLAVVSVYIWFTRKSFRYALERGKNYPPTLYRLSVWQKGLGLLTCGIILAITFGLIFFVSILVSLLPFYAPSEISVAHLTLSNYQALLFSPAYAAFYGAVRNSIIIALITATLSTFLAIFLSYAAFRSKSRFARIFEYLSSLPLGVPSIVYGLAFLWLFLSIPFIHLYGTIWSLIIALVVVWMPQSVRIISPTILQMDKTLEEAPAVLGAKWLRILRTVILPSLKNTLVVSFLFVFMDTIRELGAVTLLVTGQSYSYTLTTFIADLITSTSLNFPVVGAISTVVIGLLLAILLITNYAMRGKLFVTSSESEA